MEQGKHPPFHERYHLLQFEEDYAQSGIDLPDAINKRREEIARQNDCDLDDVTYSTEGNGPDCILYFYLQNALTV